MAVSEIYLGDAVASNISKAYLGATLIFSRTSTLLTGHIANYRLDETTGAVIDSKGGYNGTNYGATRGVTGQIGNAFSFTVNDYVETPLSFGDIDYSISLRVKLDSKSSTQVIIGKGVNQLGGNANGLELSIIYTNSTDKFRFLIANQTTSQVIDSTTTPAIDTWYYLLAIHSATDNTIKLFVNGVEENSAATTVTPSSSTALFTIGSFTSGGGSQLFLGGDVDEINVWNRALTSAEALEDSQRTEPIPLTLNDGLIANYRLDETTGNVIDSKGGYHGSNNGATRGVTGQIGNAFSFDGVNDYVDLGDQSPFESLTAFTLSARIYITSLPTGGLQTIMAKFGATTAATQSFYLVIYDEGANNTTQLRYLINNGGATTAAANAATNLVINTWYHVAMTWSGATGRVIVYLNGISDLNVLSGKTGTTPNDTTKVGIGARTLNTTPSNFFNGTIDDVNFWNRTLTAAEVLEDSQRTAPIPRTLNDIIVSNWKLDETTGAVIDSVNAYNGTNNGATPNVAGKLGTAYSFDGVNDTVNVGDVAALSFGNGTTDSPFSISAWIYINAIGLPLPIISKYSNTTANTGEWTFQITPTGTVALALIDSLVANRESRVSTNILSSGQWYHVVATYDGRGGSGASAGIKIFIDENEAAGYTSTDNGTYVAMENTTTGVTIGSALLSYATPTYFNGKIDDIQIYNQTLTTAEITELYNSGVGKTYPF